LPVLRRLSLRACAATLEERGITPRNGKSWHAAQLQRMLAAPAPIPPVTTIA
jgi:hypothetical protein